MKSCQYFNYLLTLHSETKVKPYKQTLDHG